MSGQQLKELAIRLYGDRGWQSALAKELGRDVATIRRWISSSGQIPVLVALAAEALEQRASDHTG